MSKPIWCFVCFWAQLRDLRWYDCIQGAHFFESHQEFDDVKDVYRSSQQPSVLDQTRSTKARQDINPCYVLPSMTGTCLGNMFLDSGSCQWLKRKMIATNSLLIKLQNNMSLFQVSSCTSYVCIVCWPETLRKRRTAGTHTSYLHKSQHVQPTTWQFGAKLTPDVRAARF